MTPSKRTNGPRIEDVYNVRQSVENNSLKVQGITKNMDRKLNEIQKTAQEQNNKFNKEIETKFFFKPNRNPRNNTVTELKNSLESFYSRCDQPEERINKTEDRTYKIT